MILKPGARLISAVCTAELMTVKAPKIELDVTIGGVATITLSKPQLSKCGIQPSIMKSVF
jgi:hypothetical protein